MENGTFTLTERHKRLLAAIKERRDGNSNSTTIRALASKYDLSPTSLFRALQTDGSPHALLGQSYRRGRGIRLKEDEEKMVVDAIKDFASQGTPMDRRSISELVEILVSSFPDARKRSIGFTNNRPGRKWMRLFLERHPGLILRKRVQLDKERAEAMSPYIVATHFARLRALIEKYDIADPTRIFNLNESGFSVRGMTLGGRAKCVVAKGSRGNSVDAKFRGTCDHVTLMPVVLAAGQALTPVIVLPGKEAKYRRRACGVFETPSDFLPQPNYCYNRPVAGVDSSIFFMWAQEFVKETAHLRRDGRHLLLVLDGFAGHITFRTLNLLKENNFKVLGLPAHTSHVLQPLDVGVFAPLKENFKRLFGVRSVASDNNIRNDVFTICEILTQAYHAPFIPSNIISGLRAGILSNTKRDIDPDSIRASDFTNHSVTPNLPNVPHTRSVTTVLETSTDESQNITNFKRLCGSLKVTTTTGATLTSVNVLGAVKVREDGQKEKRMRREAAEAQRKERVIEREVSRREKEVKRAERDQELNDREELDLLRLKVQRDSRRDRLKETRCERRRKARSRAHEIFENS